MIGRRDAIGVEIREEGWVVAHLEGGFLARGPVADFIVEGDMGERAGKLKAYIREHRLGNPAIALAFPGKDSFLKVLSLPSTGSKAISRMLGFELERHLPSNAEDWRWSFASQKAEGTSTAIMFSAIKTARAEQVLNALKAAEITPALVTSGQAALAHALSQSGFLPKKGLSAAASIDKDGLNLQVFRSGALEYSSQVCPGMARQAFSFACSHTNEAPTSLLVIDECVSSDSMDVILEEARRFFEQVRVFGPIPAHAPSFGAGLMAFERDAGGASVSEQDIDFNMRKRAVVAAVTGVFAVLAVGGVLAVNDMLALRKVEQEIAGLGEDRVRAEALLGEVKALAGDMDALEEIKGASSSGFLETLRRLTELTPEDTYLTGLEYAREAIIVDGVSQKASGLFMNLSRSGLAEEINYDGPVLRDQDGKERFRIKFRNQGGHGDEDTRLGS